jgi:hydrogenase maturation protein HypF
MAVSWLYRIYGRGFLQMELPVLHQVDPEKTELILRMIDRRINCPLTSGAGRLFDAVASLLGLCQTAAFPAQAPMLLETLLGHAIHGVQAAKAGNNTVPSDSLSSELTPANGIEQYEFQVACPVRIDGIIRGVVDDLGRSLHPALISRKFHDTIISIIFETVRQISEREGILTVVLSGGVFQNKYLLEGTERLLTKNKFNVYSHAAIPANDGGIALGQMAVAADRRRKGCV